MADLDVLHADIYSKYNTVSLICIVVDSEAGAFSESEIVVCMPDLPTTPKIFSRLFLEESSGRFSAMIMRDCIQASGALAILELAS